MKLKLSDTQYRCVQFFAATYPQGRLNSDFASGTLASVRKLGLIEAYRGIPWNGARYHNMYRATVTGLRMVGDSAAKDDR